MADKVSTKYAFSGLLVLLVAGAVLFFALNAFKSDSSPMETQDANQSIQEDYGTPENLSVGNESIPQEVIENSMSELNEADQQKFQNFIDISRSGKDNDPRIDKDLRNLSPELKVQLKNYYRNLVPEKRNERGLVSFLIAREIKTAEDVDFLREVVSEEPCLSMQDCKILSPKDPHLGSVDDVSLSYPKLTALYQVEKRLENDSNFLADSNMKSQVRAFLAAAANSPEAKVHDKAEEIQKRFSL